MMGRELESLPRWSQETMPKPKPQSLGAPLLTHTEKEREKLGGFCESEKEKRIGGLV